MVLLFCSYYTWVTLTYESLGKKFQRNPTGVSEIKSVRSHATHKKGVMRSLLIKGIFYCTWWASGCIYRPKVREYLPELQKKWNVHLEARAMIPQTMPSIVIICKMMSAPVLKFATQGRITIWSVGGAETTAKGKSPGFLSSVPVGNFLYVSKFLCLKSASWKRGNDSHGLKWYFFFCLQMWEQVTEERVCMLAKSLQLCLTLQLNGLYVAHRLLCPWDSPGNDTGAGCYALLQGIFPIQGLNLHFSCLLHRQMGSLPHCHLGSLEEHAMLKNESMIILGTWLSPGLYVVQEGWMYCIKLSAKHNQVSPPTLESGSLLTGLLGGLSIILSELFPETL